MVLLDYLSIHSLMKHKNTSVYSKMMHSMEKLKKIFDPTEEDLILKMAETKSFVTLCNSFWSERKGILNANDILCNFY